MCVDSGSTRHTTTSDSTMKKKKKNDATHIRKLLCVLWHFLIAHPAHLVQTHTHTHLCVLTAHCETIEDRAMLLYILARYNDVWTRPVGSQQQHTPTSWHLITSDYRDYVQGVVLLTAFKKEWTTNKCDNTSHTIETNMSIIKPNDLILHTYIKRAWSTLEAGCNSIAGELLRMEHESRITHPH